MTRGPTIVSRLLAVDVFCHRAAKTWSDTDLSVDVVTRKRPSGLTVLPMNLPYGVMSRSPRGLRIWLEEIWRPSAYSVPTRFFPKPTVVP